MTFDDEPVEAFRRSTVRPLDVADAEAQLPLAVSSDYYDHENAIECIRQ